MTNPGNAVGTNGAYGGRTSVDAFNAVLSAFSGRGIMSGWKAVPGGALNVNLGGSALIDDVAIATSDLGKRTIILNRSSQPITVDLEAAPTLGFRIDVIVAYVNNPPDAIISDPIQIDNPSVCGLIAVSSGVSNTPTVPDETMIRAAITEDGAAGSTAYYVVLATVAISAGMTTVTQDNITQGSTATLGAAGLADNSVTTPKILDGAVTGNKIAQGAVGSHNIDWSTVNVEHTASVVADVFESGSSPTVRYRQFGKLVQVRVDEFRFKESTVTGTVLATGLPPAIGNTEVVFLTSVNAPSTAIPSIRLRINQAGQLVAHYATITPKLIYGGNFMYFCKD